MKWQNLFSSDRNQAKKCISRNDNLIELLGESLDGQ